jgi:hypothetical protein
MVERQKFPGKGIFIERNSERLLLPCLHSNKIQYRLMLLIEFVALAIRVVRFQRYCLKQLAKVVKDTKFSPW